MKKIFERKLLAVTLFLFSIFAFAQEGGSGTPPTPGGSGEVGAPATSPIDMYQVFLLMIAVTMIVYFIGRRKTKTA